MFTDTDTEIDCLLNMPGGRPKKPIEDLLEYQYTLNLNLLQHEVVEANGGIVWVRQLIQSYIDDKIKNAEKEFPNLENSKTVVESSQATR